MDREDKGRLFVIGSVMIEIVTPLLQQRLEKCYTRFGFAEVQSYLNSVPVKHTLFHLRHRHSICCKDSGNCQHNQALPVTFHTWKMLYDECSSERFHICHCNYSAKKVGLYDLHAEISSLVLLFCCNLSPHEEGAIRNLRELRNGYLSHNTSGGISRVEYDTIWLTITTSILQLDPSLQDDLIRLEHRPLDESLYNKYSTELFDIHTKLEEIGTEFSIIKERIEHNKEDADIMLKKMDESKDETTKIGMASKENFEILKKSYDQMEAMVKEMKDTTRSHQRETDKSSEDTNKMMMKNLEELKHSYFHLQGMITEIKNTTQQQSEQGDTQVKEIKTQHTLTGEEDKSKFANVQTINELKMAVEQQNKCDFTLFSPGCNVQVGTIVVGNQNITVTSIDQMSQITSNSQTMRTNSEL